LGLLNLTCRNKIPDYKDYIVQLIHVVSDSSDNINKFAPLVLRVLA